MPLTLTPGKGEINRPYGKLVFKMRGTVWRGLDNKIRHQSGVGLEFLSGIYPILTKFLQEYRKKDMKKPQRIRDPLHNLIEFDGKGFDQTLWKLVQTPSFQRLRRIKQLGFSEYVYPGATHTRFAHSLGTYHIAKKLLGLITKEKKEEETRCKHALTAALLHDIGHGTFSHAFEEVGKKLNLSMAHHENVSEAIIRDSEVSEILDGEHGVGFSTNVANLIKTPTSAKIYGAVVSSQFDADRLDYIQRDRLMAGTQLGGIDFNWLMSNLEIGAIKVGSDDEEAAKEIETFVLGPKAIYAAEAYLLSLFQLYPTLYFHKTTRCFEKLFQEMLVRLFTSARDNNLSQVNLPANHPLIQFAQEPDKLDLAMKLDDTVVMGALPMLVDSEDKLIAECAKRICNRKVLKCIDVREKLKGLVLKQDKGDELRSKIDSLFEKIKTASSTGKKDGNYLEDMLANLNELVEQAEKSKNKRLEEKLTILQAEVVSKLADLNKDKSLDSLPSLLYDVGRRDVYKEYQNDKGLINQVMIRDSSGNIVDIGQHSAIIKAIQPFEFYRVYVNEKDTATLEAIDGIIKGL